MSLTDAQKRANDKWREKFDEVRFRVPKGQKEVIQAHAESMGESFNAFLRRATAEAMERDQANKEK